MKSLETALSPPRLILEISIGKLLSVTVADNEAGGLLFSGPRRREAAWRGHRLKNFENPQLV